MTFLTCIASWIFQSMAADFHRWGIGFNTKNMTRVCCEYGHTSMRKEMGSGGRNKAQHAQSIFNAKKKQKECFMET